MVSKLVSENDPIIVGLVYPHYFFETVDILSVINIDFVGNLVL